MDESIQTLSAMLPPPPDIRGWMCRANPRVSTVHPFQPRRILVVGLATPTAFSIAASFPEASVLATDEDPAAAALADVAARDMGLINLSVIAADLEDSDNPSGSFGWIHCPDPLGPTGNEEAAWRGLAGRLAPDGLLTARLRSRRQEYWGDEFREALAIIAGADAGIDFDAWMALGRRLAGDLGRSGSRLSPAARGVEASVLRTQALTAALALLPAGRSHTPDSARALLAKAGLVWLGVLNEPDWDSRGILADPEMESLQAELTHEERIELADILRAPDLLFVCGRPRIACAGRATGPWAADSAA